jgi:PLP dependent protein
MSDTCGEPTDPDRRRTEIAANLNAVNARIEAACAGAGRTRAAVTLIAVTKTFPSSDIELLRELGILDVGENRDQEASRKVDELTAAWHEPAQQRLRWHFIGALQTNKAASVARYASVVHSVDRLRLVAALSSAAGHRASPLQCLVQVNLDPSRVPGRAGAKPDDVTEIADAIAAAPTLELAGVMGVAPLGGDPHAAFERLARVALQLRRDHPRATLISAGMSGDLEQAVANGATHLRVGAALLGSRPHAG